MLFMGGLDADIEVDIQGLKERGKPLFDDLSLFLEEGKT